MTLSSVVLPEPHGPRRATTSPGATSSETSRSASTRAVALAEMLGDARRARPAARARQRPSTSASQRRGRVDLERQPHAEALAIRQTTMTTPPSASALSGSQHDPARKVVLDAAR